MTVLLWAVCALALANTGLLVVLLLRKPADPLAPLAPRLDALERLQERAERTLREELARNREEATSLGRGLREEVTTSLTKLGAGTLKQLEAVTTSLAQLGDGTAKQLEGVRAIIEQRLLALQQDNAQKLEAMRQTVDEKLQGTLEKRLGESFRLVSERLEQVHKGLGEMQTLASGVGDLKKVLTNVKTRGTWGEVQLGTLLEQILSPVQYEQNVATRPGSGERVEFAVRLPGPGEDEQSAVWLPIDAKFPLEDYLRVVEAQEAGNAADVESAARQLEVRIKASAKDICAKYLEPPATTDIGIMYLPTEGLYAEVLRRPGLTDWIQRECRVTVAGPTTLTAILASLQMGFRTLAIQKRSSEVWMVLGAVKTEFEKFGGVLDKVKKKLQEATNVVDSAAVRSRVIERKLKDVQTLPAADGAAGPLPALPNGDLFEIEELLEAEVAES